MASILKSKSSESRVGPSGLAGFNLNDFASNGRQLLQRAEEEAKRIIAAANQEADQIRQSAQHEGLAAGLAEGRKTIEDEIQQRVQTELQNRLGVLEKTSQQLSLQQSEWLDRFAETLQELAIGIAEKIVLKRLDREPEIVVAWTAQALRQARSARSLVIAVHPETLVKLGQPLEALIHASGVPEDTRIEPDESLEEGGVVVRQTGGSVDTQLSSQLKNITEMLT